MIARRDYDFFRAQAGGIVGRSAETAYMLARAEREAVERGWRVEWEHDDEPYDSDDDYEPNVVLCAVLYDADGHVLCALCGIADPSREYARVVAAGLALEALQLPRYRYPHACTEAVPQ